MIPPRINDVKVLDDYNLEIYYQNDEVRVYDMKRNLIYGFFEKLKNIEYFKKVKSVGTTLEWPNGEDVDPNELYENSKKIN